METNKTFWMLIAVVTLVGGVLVGYLYGAKNGGDLSYKDGYSQGQADFRVAQEEVARKAAEEAAKFSLQVDPFAKVKDVLNPFK